MLLRVQVVFGRLGGCQLVERRANAALAERAQYKVGTLAVSGGGRLSRAAFLRPEATHNTFKMTFVQLRLLVSYQAASPQRREFRRWIEAFRRWSACSDAFDDASRVQRWRAASSWPWPA